MFLISHVSRTSTWLARSFLLVAALQFAAAATAATPAEAEARKNTAATGAATGKNDGAILVIRVTGGAYAAGPGGAARAPLTKGARVAAGQTIITDKNASVMLVLSNGATLTIAGGSELAVEEFAQEPFAGTFHVTEISQEPTISTTRLDLQRGEIIAEVKKLNQGGNSSFSIKTPVGVAGIRGTAFRLGFHEAREPRMPGLRRYGHVSQKKSEGPGAARQQLMVFDLITLEGEVEARLDGGAAPVSVSAEKQLRFDNVRLDLDTGRVDADSLATPMVRNAPASDLTEIRRMVRSMAVTAASEAISSGGEKPAADPEPALAPPPLPASPGAQVPAPRLSPTDGE
ncbi:MAG: FecR family protein [Opitutaceae bacterium]|jgi:hypothetical protein|nr:FecR family protein [Opitutaceae bacterium]